MKTRRLFLKVLLGAATLPFVPPVLRQPGRLRIRSLGGGFHEVEGWILTSADLQMLRHHVS
jgi:hypothetical protein